MRGRVLHRDLKLFSENLAGRRGYISLVVTRWAVVVVFEFVCLFLLFTFAYFCLVSHLA